MDNIFMNSDNSKTYGPHRLLLNYSDKTILQRRNKYVALSNLSINYTGKNITVNTKTINLKYWFQRGMEKLNYLMDHILYQIFKIIVGISSQNTKQRLIILQ